MVKNIGGNKAKRQGRKHTQGTNNYSTRKSSSDDEKYSIITKMYGGGRTEVKCIDGITRIMIIRNKFKGRNKRDNIISINTWVLVGLRSWEVRRKDTKENCDLLEVYNSNDIEHLKQSVDANWIVLIGSAKLNQTTEESEEHNLDFTDERTQKYEELLNSEDTKKEDIETAMDWLADDADAKSYDSGNNSDFNIDDI